MAMRVLRRRLDALQVREHRDPRRAVLGDRPAVEHADHARLLQGLREIQLPDPRVRVRAAEERDVREAREAQVVDEGAAPLQQALRVRPRHALADVAPVELRARRVQRQLSLAHATPPRWRRRSPGIRCSGSSCRRCAPGSLPAKLSCPAGRGPARPSACPACRSRTAARSSRETPSAAARAPSNRESPSMVSTRAAVGLHRQHQAAAHDLAVHAHGAGAAHAVLAADVRAGQAQLLAQEIHQVLARAARGGSPARRSPSV